MQRRDDDGQGTNHHGPNYHRPRINQPALNEKEPRPQGAGAQLVQGQRVWPGTFGRKSTPAWATTPLNVTRYERPETAYRQNLGARVLFFKVAPGQPFCSSGQGMKSILAKASRSFDRFFPFRRFCTAGGACPMADMLLGIGHRNSLSKSMRWQVPAGRSRNPCWPVRCWHRVLRPFARTGGAVFFL